jgi:hypothetical protein
MTGPSVLVPIRELSTKQLQYLASLNVTRKPNINKFEPEDIILSENSAKIRN